MTIHIQSNHQFPSPSTTSVPLVRTGAEDIVKDKLSDDFVLRSSEKLKVLSIDKEQNILNCIDEKGIKVILPFKDKVLKNGGAGFYFSTKYELDKNIKVGSILKPKDKYAYSTSLFKNGILSTQGKMVKLALIPSLELVEDAALVSDRIANEINLPFVYDKSIDLMENHYIANFKKIGEKINAEEDLLEFSEGLPKESKGSQDLLDDLFGDDIKRKVRSPAKGYITDIKIIYNKPDTLLMEQEKALIKYLMDLDEKDGKTNSTESRVIKEPQGKILGRRLSDTMVVTYYISKDLKGASGSKLTLQSTKGVYRVVPEKDMPRLEDGSYAEVMISTFSTITRMTMGAITSNIYSNTIVATLKDRFATMIQQGKLKSCRTIWSDFVKKIYKNDKKFLDDYLKDFLAKDDKALEEFFNDLHMIVRPFNEPKLKDLVNYAIENNIAVEQQMYMYDEDTQQYSKMLKKGICGYAMIKFLTQLISKKTSQNHKVSDINVNTGTLTENAKVAKLGREEANACFSYGVESTILPELLTYRADDAEARISMDKKIIENGKVSLSEISSSGTGQISNLIAFNLIGAGYDSTFKSAITAKEEGETLDIR